MRAKRIYYLDTDENTYLLRHVLYNAGARWDARARKWWGTNLATMRRAAEMVGESAKPVKTYVQKLPSTSPSGRGSRPRAPRGGVKTPQQNGHVQIEPLAAAGTPFVRRGAGNDRRTEGADRRKTDERRDEGKRPEAVLVVPMVEA